MDVSGLVRKKGQRRHDRNDSEKTFATKKRKERTFDKVSAEEIRPRKEANCGPPSWRKRGGGGKKKKKKEKTGRKMASETQTGRREKAAGFWKLKTSDACKRGGKLSMSNNSHLEADPLENALRKKAGTQET